MDATCIDTREYPSTRRGSDAKYVVQKFDNGTMSCNCPGWRFWKDQSKPRSCSHLGWYAQDYHAVTFGFATKAALRGERWEKVMDIPTGMLIRYFNVASREPQRGGFLSSIDVRNVPAAKPKPLQRPTSDPPARARVAFDEEV